MSNKNPNIKSYIPVAEDNNTNSKTSESFLNPTKDISSNEKGMTLIEIVIVLAIVAGLASMLYQSVFKNYAKSQVSQTKIIMGEVMQSLQLYQVDCQRYPSALDGLMSNSGSECKNWGPDPYLKKYPKDAWGHDLEYESNGGNYVLKSLGKDGREGGSGSDADISSEDID